MIRETIQNMNEALSPKVGDIMNHLGTIGEIKKVTKEYVEWEHQGDTVRTDLMDLEKPKKIQIFDTLNYETEDEWDEYWDN